MSFGFGVGDFLAVIKVAKKIRSDFVNATNEFKSITDELQNVEKIREDIELYLDDLSETQKETFKNITRTYDNVLNDLAKLRHKYSELDDTPQDGTANAPAAFLSKRRRVRRFCKRITWDSSQVATLRQRLSWTFTTLQAFLDTITRQRILKVDEGVARLDHQQEDWVKKEVLEWLTPINYGSEQSDFLSRKQNGTGQWFLDSSEYRDWIREDRRTLFCPGIPGAGKTILTSIVVDELTKHFESDKTVGIAYLYCNFRRNHDQKLTDLVASLLKQLASTLSSVPSCLTALHARHKNAGTRPLLQELIDALHAVAGSFPKTFVLVDALDECQTMDRCRSKLISEMFDMQSKCGTNIFATSRIIPDITTKFSSMQSTQVEIRARRKDIEKFLDENISNLHVSEDWNDELKNTVKTTISGLVDGMFLLAHIYLQSLDDKTKPKDVKEVLKSLRKQEPGSSESQRKEVLGLAYDDAMTRINKQGKSLRELAMNVLLWITFAKRPLRAMELQHALAVAPDDSDLDLENMSTINRMVTVCAGLVTVDAQGGIIRLVHYTTQEYFEQKQHDLFPYAQYQMAEICATYLTFGSLTKEHDNSFWDTDQYRLYDYCCQNWGRHVCKSGMLGPSAANFLQDYRSLLKLCFVGGRSIQVSPVFVPQDIITVEFIQTIGIHLSSCCGIELAVAHLIHKGADINSTDLHCRTPLSYASKAGHEAVVRLLLSRDDVVPDSRDSHDRTPLSYAAEEGNEAVARLLLSRNDVKPDSIDNTDMTPLFYAAQRGHEEVVRLLLDRDDIVPNSTNDDGMTVLFYAALGGQEAVVRLLLSRDDVVPDSKNDYGRTPLSYASEAGHEAVARLLLSRNDVAPDSRDSHDRTPLSYAAEAGREAVVRLLLSRNDVVADSTDSSGRTPLSYAAEKGNDAAARVLLIMGGADPNFKDSKGETPFLAAARWGGANVCSFPPEELIQTSKI